MYIHKDDKQRVKGSVETLDVECADMEQYYTLTLGFKLLLSDSVINTALSKGMPIPNPNSMQVSTSSETSPYHHYMIYGDHDHNNRKGNDSCERTDENETTSSMIQREETERNTGLWLASMTYLHADIIHESNSDPNCGGDNDNDSNMNEDPITSLFTADKINKLKLAAKVLFSGAPALLEQLTRGRTSSTSSSYHATQESNVPPAQFLGWKAPGTYV